MSDEDDNEFEVIMGRPFFHGPELISLLEALDMANAPPPPLARCGMCSSESGMT
jgi:hypothetical protein